MMMGSQGNINNKYAEDGLFIISILAILLVLLNLGYGAVNQDLYSKWFPILNLFAFAFLFWRIFINWKSRKLQTRYYAGQTFVLALTLLAILSELFFHKLLLQIKITTNTSLSSLIYHAIFLFLFLEEVSNRLFAIKRTAINGPFLLIISFVFIILIGSLLLMLPSATTRPISYVDALFTSTSAVCVTGLVVLDTAKDFTLFGQWVILFLIQLGGLGILTFTNLFGLIFSGNTTFHNQMMIQSMLNVDNLNDALKALVRIVTITLIIEVIGALLIFFTVDQGIFNSDWSRLFFSLFHSISAFCNAGFSTLGNDGLYHPSVRFAYNFQLLIAILIVFGGIGFGILLNLLQFIKESGLKWYSNVVKHRPYRHKPQIINLNTKIVVTTTVLLLLTGTVFYYAFEYNNVLAEHTTAYGKIVQSFFGSVTPRTAGFNTVDIAQLTIPTLMIYLLLMWIGGSPGSTAGGIKTSVFAVATLNILNAIRGKERLETTNREIEITSVNRVFAIISLSLIAVGASITLIIIKDGHKFDLLKIAFECFSALGTVGLSMGITPNLTDFSKLVLVVTMFIGRVGFLTILIGILKLFIREREKRYRYPKEELFIT